MRIVKIKMDIPDREELLRGLELRQLHAPLIHAEAATKDAEQALVRLRAYHVGLDRLVAALPADIRHGSAAASALPEALGKRDAALLQLADLERAVQEQRDMLRKQEVAARAALEAEIVRRTARLQRAADELSPVLHELRELEILLGRELDKSAVSLGLGVNWPRSLQDEVSLQNAALQAGIRIA